MTRRHMVFALGMAVALLAGFASDAGAAPVRRKNMLRSGLASVQLTSKLDLQAIDEAGGIIDKVIGNTADVYLLPEDFEQLRARGFSLQWIRDEGKESLKELWDRTRYTRNPLDAYHTNDEIRTQFALWKAAYPTLFSYDSIGMSVLGRPLLVAKLSDNVTVDEAEIEVKYVANMHGDETVGKENCLRFIDTLLTGYGIDAELTTLMTEYEMWFLPLMNPDGNYSSTRYNANGVDLNRDFPDRCDDSVNTTTGRQVETAHVMNWTAQHNFVMSANFHGGALVTNYPWDNNCNGGAVYAPTPEDCVFVHISKRYSSYNSPMWNSAEFLYGITNGADWYEVSGGMQDWNYVWMGDKELTIELSTTKNPPVSALEQYWIENRQSMKYYWLEARYGVRGVVTDSITGQPLRASVQLSSIPYLNYSGALHGEYYHVLRPGTYSFTFSAPGYVSKTVTGVTVVGTTPTVLNVQLRSIPATLEVQSVTVLDGGGNGNGALDAGETDGLDVTLRNTGGSGVTNVSAVLSTSDPYITINTGSDNLASLPAQQSGVVSYNVTVAPSAPSGHLVTFLVTMTGDGYSGSDDFTLTIGLATENFETGGFTHYPWRMDGHAAWVITTSSPYEGTYCAKSGSIGNDQFSDMYLTAEVGAPGTISFYYKVSSEANFDFLEFYVDAVRQNRWSGTAGWAQASFGVSAGVHTFRWRYSKDGAYVSGSDCGWIDYIVFPPLLGVLYPDIDLNPDSFAVLLEPGDTTSRLLEVSNVGDESLDFDVTVALDNPRLTCAPFIEFGKGETDPRAGSRTLDSHGGPDSYGYRWVDSDDAGGPVYGWIEISGTGTSPGDADEANYGPFNLGFTFNYYGTNYTQVRICTNGWLSFTSTSTAYSNQSIPNTAAPNCMIAPFWDDLSPNIAGTIYYRADTSPRRFIVEWSGVSHYNSSGTPTSPETFQVILNEDGTIVYQYQTVALGTGCTVGIENAAGTVGLQVVFNASYLHNSLAVRFARQTPWMTVTPLSGTVLPQGSAMLTVSFDAGDLAEGVYTGVIGVSSNDPYDPVLEVPVTFTVGGPPDPVDDLTIVPSGDHVRLSWSAALLAAGYRVYRMTDVSQPYTAGELLTPIPITDTTYLDMFRPIGMNFYQVVAVR